MSQKCSEYYDTWSTRLLFKTKDPFHMDASKVMLLPYPITTEGCNHKTYNAPVRFQCVNTLVNKGKNKEISIIHCKTPISRAEAKARRNLAILRKLTGTQCGAAETVLKNVNIGTIRPHLEYWSTQLSSVSKSAIYTLDKVQNQALRLIRGSMIYTPIRVMEETTAIQPLSKISDMRNLIQNER